MKYQFSILAVILLVLTAGTGRAGSSPSRATTLPSFKAARCPFTLGKGLIEVRDVQCGYLTVPENRTVANGRTVQLAVAIFKGRGRSPAPDPVVYLHGGPGGAIVASLGSTINAGDIDAYVGRRAIILLDQRGAGLSRPSLDCPEVTTATYRGYELHLYGEKQRQNVEQALRACHTRLVQAGIDLSAYNTVENASDIADLRTALGYTQINLYGGSYGTRLALQVMRDQPQGIRSVVLDAVADPTFNEFTDAIPNAWRALSLVFKECAAAPICNAGYPLLERTFDQLASKLQTHPISINVDASSLQRTFQVRVDGAALVELLMAALYSYTVIPEVPALIVDTAQGNYALLTQIASDTLLSQKPGQGIGAYLSAECSDDQAGATPATIAARASMVPASIRAGVIADRAGVLTLCQIWQVKSVNSINRQLFSSAIPTLLLNGQLDPRIPPDLAARLARQLKHGYFLLFPARGHGVRFTGDCPESIVAAFLDHPDQRPASACIAQMPPAFQ
jgi:pimeloyl-ACP methyl ester carboxylesterase